MEHAQNTRRALAALLLITAAGGLASCATAPAPEWGQTPAGHRQLVRASADRYVDEQIQRARSFCEPSTTEPAPVLDDRCPSAAG